MTHIYNFNTTLNVQQSRGIACLSVVCFRREMLSMVVYMLSWQNHEPLSCAHLPVHETYAFVRLVSPVDWPVCPPGQGSIFEPVPWIGHQSLGLGLSIIENRTSPTGPGRRPRKVAVFCTMLGPSWALYWLLRASLQGPPLVGESLSSTWSLPGPCCSRSPGPKR